MGTDKKKRNLGFIGLCIVVALVVMGVNLHKRKQVVSYTDAMRPKIETLLSTRTNGTEYNRLLILPTTGCTDCILGAEEYFVNHAKEEDFFFIITDISSIKLLELRLGKERIYQDNVYLDKDRSFYLSRYKEVIYPFYGELNGGKLGRFFPL